MALVRLDLNQFKSSGVVTIEFDASENIVLNTQTTRLVVGFSRKGPFNQPVFLPDIKTASRVFGDVDPFLERRGSFFHRSLFTCLQIGPVFALNLLPLNNTPITEGGDAVTYRSFSLDTAESNGVLTSDLFSSFYNKESFWIPDTEYFLANVNNDLLNEGKLFNLVNLGQTPVSILIKKSDKSAVKSFDITARQWFGASNVPAYINEWDYVGDYFIDVYIVQGNWTDYTTLSIDPVFSKYFNSTGMIKSKLKDFLAAPEVITIANFTGSLIPDFIDGNGINYSVDTIINQGIGTTGIFVALNREALENYDPEISTHTLDLVGHQLADPTNTVSSVDFLSYKTPVTELLTYTENDPGDGLTATEYTVDGDQLNMSDLYFGVDHAHIGGSGGYFGNILVIPKPSTDQITGFTIANYTEIKENLLVGSSAILLNNSHWGKVESISEVSDSEAAGGKSLKVAYTNPGKSTEPSHANLTITAVVTTPSSMSIKVSGDQSANISVGDPLFVEHPTTGLYYYFECSATATFASSVTTIPVVDSVNISSVTTSYKANFGYTIGPDIDADTNGSVKICFKPDTIAIDSVPTPDVFIAYEFSQIYVDYINNILTNGDKYYPSSTASAVQYVGITKTTDIDGLSIVKIKLYTDEELTTVSNVITPGFNNYKKNDSGSLVTAGSGVLALYSSAGNLSDRIPLISYNSSKTTFVIADADKSSVEVGQYVVTQTADGDDNPIYRLTRILTKKKKVDNVTGIVTYEFTVNQPIRVIGTSLDVEYVERFIPIDDFVTAYQFTYLSGFKLTSYHLPGDRTNKAAQLAKILSVLDPLNSNLTKSLASSDIIQFRYVVDTFDGGLNVSSYPKNYLTKLAKERQKCLAIMNAPSIKEFIDSTDPRFTDAPDPASGNPKPLLNTQYIADGGNLQLGPSFTYSLPDEDNGAKYAGFYGPFLTIRENGKNINIPPAAHISNLFIQKFINGTPYAIVAGTRRGIISEPRMVGLEYDFTQSDRDSLEPFGYNPIIKKRGVGIMVYGNQTAYQKTSIALNNLHVRDLLITIEETVESILSRYIFETNNAATRLEIKNIVNGYLSTVQSDNGVYTFQVVMNDKNNSPDIIDQNVAIIDIGVEPVRGMQKFVNRVTILKTGGISSGGFTVA